LVGKNFNDIHVAEIIVVTHLSSRLKSMNKWILLLCVEESNQ
jgi:hypothetical protein